MREPREDRTQTADAVVSVAAAAGPGQVRRLEERLARLSAGGVVEVWDGRVVDWPALRVAPLVRPLQNLPRVAPLPEAVWWALVGGPDPRRAAAGRLCPGAARLRRGTLAVVAITGAGDAALLAREAGHCGVVVTSIRVDAARFAALRARRRPPAGPDGRGGSGSR